MPKPTPTKDESKKGLARGLPFLKGLSKKTSLVTPPEVADCGDDKKNKKQKKLRHIRGLLTGESRRERRVKREAERAAAAATGTSPPVPLSSPDDDEQDTVYGVDVENQSTTDALPVPTMFPNPQQEIDDEEGDEPSIMTEDDNSLSERALQVILLLMDPKTRRFELLQLEFDSNKAVVRDVLSHVPHSVTEEALRNQNYVGVCDSTGQELYYSTRLCDVCSGSEVLIALPENVDASECTKLARPILQHSSVIEMLRASGVDTSGLETKDAMVASPPAKVHAARSSADIMTPPAVVAPPSVVSAATPAEAAPSPQAVAPPPQAAAPPPQAVAPPAKSAPAKAALPPVAATIPVPAPSKMAAPLPEVPAPTIVAAQYTSAPELSSHASQSVSIDFVSPSTNTNAEVIAPRVEEKRVDSKRILYFILFTAIAVLIQVIHMSVTAPLSPGQSLSPNAFMSKCGYKALLPSCEEASLIMHEDGVLTLYNSDGSIQWEIIGTTCKSSAHGCKNGLVVNDDGSLVIGGKRVNAAAVYGEAMWTPWPFTESPQLRMVKGRK